MQENISIETIILRFRWFESILTEILYFVCEADTELLHYSLLLLTFQKSSYLREK